MSIRGVIVVLLCRLGLPSDVARYIYNLRRAEYDATYWWLMGRHYTIAARHKLIWRRPISFGGGYGQRLVSLVIGKEWARSGDMFEIASVRYLNRDLWLNIVSAHMYTYRDPVIRVHLASRSKLKATLDYSDGCYRGDTYVNGAVPFAEFALWHCVGVHVVGGTADCASRIEQELPQLEAFMWRNSKVWTVLMPAYWKDGVLNRSAEEALVHVARVMSESDYSGWQPAM